MGLITGFNNGRDGVKVDIGMSLVEKSYLIDRYPELADTFKQAGLWVWGKNNYGQIGDNTIVYKSSPVQTIAGGTNWKSVSSGNGPTIAAIKTDGTLWTWGNNNYGQIGNNTTGAHKSSPVQTISGGTNWKQVSMAEQAAAIKTDGTLWLWGRNFAGGLGDNTRTQAASPVQTIAGGTNWKQVSTSGYNITAAIKTDGTFWSWGTNNYGQIGDNTILARSSPVQTISGGTNWKQVASGSGHVAALKTDGTLWLWGRNVYGQLGDNTVAHKSSPVQTIAGGTNWKQVVADQLTSAIKTDGTLWGWGIGVYGGMGDNSATNKSSPVQTIAGGTNWKQVAAIGFGAMGAIKTDGTLWTWGNNGYGTLGDTTILNKSSPAQTIASGTNWKVLGGHAAGAAAIRDDSADLFGDPV